ncbi:MAG: DNA translocase FtsK [Planctomycetota bacterium]|jgi:S-DNA-T family DNA segregation ATPase FtsK/SpoIIIE
MKRKELFKEILGIGLVLFSLFLLVSLFTFHSGDVPFLNTPGNESLWNACGHLGVAISFRLLFSFGTLATWALALLIGGWGISLILRRSWPDLPYKVTGILLFLLALSIGEALAMDGVHANFPHGGVLGIFMTKVVLLTNLGETGTYLAVFYVAVISFLLATDFVFIETALEAAGRVRLRILEFRGKPFAASDWPIRKSERQLFREMEASQRRHEQRLRRERMLERMDGEADDQARTAWPLGTPAELFAGADLLEEPPETGTQAFSELEIPPGIQAESMTELPEGVTVEISEDPGPSPVPLPPGDSEEDPSVEVEEDEAEKPEAPKPASSPIPAPRPPRKGKTAKQENRDPHEGYALPADELLDPPEAPSQEEDRVNQVRAGILEDTLAHFKINGRVVGAVRGPSITQFELALAPGTKSSQLYSLQNDLAMAMKVEKVRIVAPLPGRGTVGVEVPNAFREKVVLREVVHAPQCRDRKWMLPLFLGKNAAGEPVLGDLTDMPHLLIAGSTGSGKSICLNSVLAGILLTKTPEEVKLVLVDPKRVEMTPYREVPHLMVPVLTEPKKAAAVLEGLTALMDQRYAMFEHLRVRQISSYNRMAAKDVVSVLKGAGMDPKRIEHPLPYIIVVVDELSDLMLQSSREVENAIIRLAQKSRAVGIHLVLSTQRPSSDVITGMIKANMPARIAFKVTSMVESRVILDQNGAEKLLGRGDMLYLPPKVSHLVRAQGTFVSDEEVGRLVRWAMDQGEPAFEDERSPLAPRAVDSLEEGDEKLYEAGDIILATGRASTTLLQRRLAIGYTRAARLVDLLEKAGLVGPFRGSKPRELLMTFEQWEAFKAEQQKGAGN